MATAHISWGYDATGLRFNTLSDVIRIDKDYGQAAYSAIDIVVPGLSSRANNYYLLIANGVTNKQEAELDLDTYGTSGKVGVFVAVYHTTVIGFFDKVNVVVGHSYARRISINPKQIVFTLTDINTRQTQTIVTPLVGSGAPFDGVDVGLEWWDDSGRPNPGTFQPQVDATITNLAADGRIINPNIKRFISNNAALQPFTVVGGSYKIIGIVSRPARRVPPRLT